MSFDIASPNTGDTLAAMAPDAVRQLWKKGVDVYEQSSDFFAPMEGGSLASLLWTTNDTSKGQGQKITITNMSGFYDEPHQGDEVFENADDFEEILIGAYSLTVDFLRHGTRITERMEELMGMRNEIVGGIPVEVGKWLGRLKTEQLLMMAREQVNDENTVYANGKTLDTLVAADTLSWDEIITMGATLQPLGGTPAKLGSDANGNPIFRNVVVSTVAANYSLKRDPTYREVLRTSHNVDKNKVLFSGGYVDIDGHIIKEYNPIDHDGEGAIGSPLNPRALLGNAIAAGTAVIAITGGGNPTSAAKTKKKYFKHFKNYAYKFIEGTQLTQDGNTYYLLAINPPNAAVDPGKMAMYSYTTGNNGNQITITGRLGAVAGGVRVTTFNGGSGSGGVTWDTAVWAGKHTETVAQGAVILPCNALGQILGWTPMLMRGFALRGYGKYRNKRTEQQHEGGAIMDRYCTSIFGQVPRQNRQGRMPGILIQCHALQYPGVLTPTVV